MGDHLIDRRTLLIRGAAALGLTRTPPALTASISPEIVGAWWVQTQGAPFAVHLMTFHADGTMLATGPDAGDPGASDSDGVGGWSTAEDRVVKGAFEEVVASRQTHQWVARVRIEFEVMVDGQTFHGPAQTTISAPDGSVIGRVDVFFNATRIRRDIHSEHFA